jgi:hypothetical protein
MNPSQSQTNISLSQYRGFETDIASPQGRPVQAAPWQSIAITLHTAVCIEVSEKVGI